MLSRWTDTGKRSKKCAFVGENIEQPQKVVQTGVPDDTRRLENIRVLDHRSGEGEGIEMYRIVWVRDVNGGVVLPLVREIPDAMEFEKLGSKYLETAKLLVLPRHEREPRIIYSGRSCGTL